MDRQGERNRDTDLCPLAVPLVSHQDGFEGTEFLGLLVPILQVNQHHMSSIVAQQLLLG